MGLCKTEHKQCNHLFKTRKRIMGSVVALLFVLIASGSLASEQPYVHVVYVDANSGNNTLQCLKSSDKYRCQSLEYVCDNLKSITSSSIQVTVCGPEINLTQSLLFEDYIDLTLTGMKNSGATINCNTSGSGLSFFRVKELSVEHLNMESCGAQGNSTMVDSQKGNISVTYNSAVYILNCTDVAIRNIIVQKSNGTGLSIFDTNGTVLIEDSHFLENYVRASKVNSGGGGGGGIHIEFTHCSPGRVSAQCHHEDISNRNSSYAIARCVLVGNIASADKNSSIIAPTSGTSFQTLGNGGGMYLSVRSTASGNIFTLDNCTFSDNSATSFGGGLEIQFTGSPRYNRVTITRTVFKNNTALSSQGGGIGMGFNFYGISQHPDLPPAGNSVTINFSLFLHNYANGGGGTSIFATRLVSSENNAVSFTNCKWIHNMALTGAAVQILPGVWNYAGNGLLTQPIFNNCTFYSNIVLDMNHTLQPGVSKLISGAGAFHVILLPVTFHGVIVFNNNTGTALYSSGSLLKFYSSQIMFQYNTGTNGGAIALYGLSALYVTAYCNFTFLNNVAYNLGGAIYFQGLVFSSYQPCFIEPAMVNGSVTLSEFSFRGNKAGDSRGNDIYTTSFTSCALYCPSSTFKSVYDCIGNFSFSNTSNSTATLPTEYIVTHNCPLKIFPGLEYQLPLVVYDADGNNMSELSYEASLVSSSSSSEMKIDPAFQYVSKNEIKIEGRPGDSATLYLNTSGNISLLINITLVECPPGYVLDVIRCTCGASAYYGIWKCDFQAYILRGFWIGYCDKASTKLCTTYCPQDYCTYNTTNKAPNDHLLPRNISQLDTYICAPTKTGTLCGECIANHSVYYNSWKFYCGSEELCHMGFLFYFLSNILPLTILFVVIVTQNVNFAHGNINGFILFAQILDTLSIHANDTIYFPPAIWYFAMIQNFFYRFFTLDFFSVEGLSFCLWKGATVMNILMVRCATIMYAFGLVIVTVFILRWGKCAKHCPKFYTRQYTLLHGISAFFVLCYSQCTRSSFEILRSICLYTDNYHCHRQVVFWSGDMEPFHGLHIKYAVVAVLFFVFIVALPPFFLLFYPLFFKLLGYCHLSESKFANFLWRLMPIQLLDTFQSSFKDNFRFFAGLYFLYRVAAIAVYMYVTTLTQYYTIIGGQIIAIISLHAVLNPYKEKKHNTIDLLLFSNLAIINGISQYNFARATDEESNFETTNTTLFFTTTVQTLFMSIPLFCIFFVVLKILLQRCKLRLRTIAYALNDHVTENTPLQN